MWYLIFPPIIVIASLLFVLWYLSRKGADPFIARKISQLEDGVEQRISFFRTKKILLRILERMVYRFKVLSLQMHNVLNDLTQTLKERRKRFQDSNVKRILKDSDEKTRTDTISSHEIISPDSHFRTSETREVSRKYQDVQLTQSETSETISRPMVSERIVRPEAPYRKTATDISREEDLITRIAVNPKDFAAYEELGDHYLGIGNVKDAKDCYRQVLKLSPVQRMAKIKIRRLEKILLQKERQSLSIENKESKIGKRRLNSSVDNPSHSDAGGVGS